MTVDISIIGEKKLAAYLRKLPRGVKITAMRAASEYIKGNEAHGLTHYPPWRGQKYVRTYNMQSGWRMRERDSAWTSVRIYNQVPYTRYVPRWKQYGWREWAGVVADNMKGAIRSAQAAVNQWLKGKGRA